MADRAGSYEVEAVQLQKRQKLQARIAIRAAYRRLFTGADGKLKDDARAVLADIGRTAKLGRVHPLARGEELARIDGMRAVALHIFGRLDTDRLIEIAEALREEES